MAGTPLGMETIEIQSTTVPALGFGTWQLRGSTCVESVRDALAAGYRLLDTAQMYGNEAEVGEGLRSSGVRRDEVFVVSKVKGANYAPDDVRSSTRASAAALGVDRIDLMLLHWPSSSVPVGETLGALRQVQDEGLVRHVGVSNFSVAEVEEAARHATIFCNQVEYHPFQAPRDLREHARAQGYLLTAYSPVAKGRVTRDRVLAGIAGVHGRTPAQVALRWLLDLGTAPIPKSADPGRRRENLGVDFALTDDERGQIDALAG